MGLAGVTNGDRKEINLYFLFNNVPIDTSSVAEYSSFTLTSLIVKQQEEVLFIGSYSNCKAECPSSSLDLWQHLRNSVFSQ